MRAKKSLGQNFLKSKEAIREIIKSADLHPGENILEVGPGKGILTEALLQSGVLVIAVEKDDSLIPLLEVKFRDKIQNGKLTLVHGDILDFDPKRYTLNASSYKLVANIPYYITGIFLRKFLGGEFQPETMVIMLQKEVAKRIVAIDKKESILSISVKVYGTPKYVMTVHKKYFNPSPNVDSVILLIENISKNFFKEVSEEKFFALIKKAFSQKRKKLISNIDFPKDKLTRIFSDLKIDQNSRAENVNAETYKEIVRRLEN